MQNTKESIREEAIKDVIARRAYELWEQEGRPEGGHLNHWYEAERQLKGTSSAPDDRTHPAER